MIDAKGKEHIVQFAPETWWVADNVSLMSGKPSDHSIDALEDSDLLLIDTPSHEAVVERVPGYASGLRKGLQRRAAAQNERIVSSISVSAHDRYPRFLETYPSLATRVPQWMLASYLGVTPDRSAGSAESSPANDAAGNSAITNGAGARLCRQCQRQRHRRPTRASRGDPLGFPCGNPVSRRGWTGKVRLRTSHEPSANCVRSR